ncbi:hypothetical protein PIB30_106947, partial [Stylosanthes scabra]|nr:hypothetical protein [Stylosanthes scabra]
QKASMLSLKHRCSAICSKSIDAQTPSIIASDEKSPFFALSSKSIDAQPKASMLETKISVFKHIKPLFLTFHKT